MVTSQANSGVSTNSLNPPILERTARYSGNTLPACLISQTGVLSTCSPLAALKIKSFLNGILI